jgi:hypothetical protein
MSRISKAEGARALRRAGYSAELIREIHDHLADPAPSYSSAHTPSSTTTKVIPKLDISSSKELRHALVGVPSHSAMDHH